jgi:glycosyltransferase involved in cell wall biosynthesis
VALLYAGRICDQKQPRVFAETIRRLAQHQPGFVAIVAGDGADLPWLRSYVADHSLDDHVCFLGSVSNARIKELLSAVDIFFLPSKMEGISLALYEAMAMGVVPVGADVGGQRELVTTECGILVPRSTEEDEVCMYVRGLRDLMRDSGRRQQMSQACRERIVHSFQLAAMGQEMIAHVQRARTLAHESPRQSINRELAHTLALNALESIRQNNMSDTLWAERARLLHAHTSQTTVPLVDRMTKRDVARWFMHRIRRYMRI